jgi:serine/threonine protein phosphatase PrpC
MTLLSLLVNISVFFIKILGDGVFDKLNNKEILDIAWDCARKNYKKPDQKIHQICGSSVEIILKASIASRSLDNVTAVLVSFKNFKKSLKL